jgi:hypothetical protein
MNNLDFEPRASGDANTNFGGVNTGLELVCVRGRYFSRNLYGSRGTIAISTSHEPLHFFSPAPRSGGEGSGVGVGVYRLEPLLRRMLHYPHPRPLPTTRKGAWREGSEEHCQLMRLEP